MDPNQRAQSYIRAKSMIALSKQSFYASRLRKQSNTKPTSSPTPLALAPIAPAPGSAPPSPTHSTTSTESSASSCLSAFSRHSGETLSTDVGEGAKGAENGAKALGFSTVYKPVTDAELASEDEDDDSVVFTKTKKVGQHHPTFATSVPTPNPYAAFTRQPGYKGPYIFPSSRC